MADDKTTVGLNANASSDGNKIAVNVDATINQSKSNSIPSVNEVERNKAKLSDGKNNSSEKTQSKKPAAAQQNKNSNTKSLLVELNATLNKLSQAIDSMVKNNSSTLEENPLEGKESLSDSMTNALHSVVYSERFKTDFSIILGKGLIRLAESNAFLQTMKASMSEAASNIGSDSSQGGVANSGKAETVESNVDVTPLNKSFEDLVSNLSLDSLKTSMDELKTLIAESSKLNLNASDKIIAEINKALVSQQAEAAASTVAVSGGIEAQKPAEEVKEKTSLIDQFISDLVGGSVKIGNVDLTKLLETSMKLVDKNVNSEVETAEKNEVEKIDESIEKKTEEKPEEVKEGTFVSEVSEKPVEEEKAEDNTPIKDFIGMFTSSMDKIFNKPADMLEKKQIEPEVKKEISSEESGSASIVSAFSTFSANILDALMPGKTKSLEEEVAPIPKFAGVPLVPKPKQVEPASEKEDKSKFSFAGIVDAISGFGKKMFQPEVRIGGKSQTIFEKGPNIGNLLGKDRTKSVREARKTGNKGESPLIEYFKRLITVVSNIFNRVVMSQDTKKRQAKDVALSKMKGTPSKKGGFDPKSIGESVKKGLSGLGDIIGDGMLKAKAKAAMKIIGLLIGLGILIYLFFTSPTFKKILMKVGVFILNALWGLVKLIWKGIVAIIKKMSVKAIFLASVLMAIAAMWYLPIGWIGGLIVMAVAFFAMLIVKFKDKILAFLKGLGKIIFFIPITIWKFFSNLFPNAAAKIKGFFTGLLSHIPFIGRFFKSDESDSEADSVEAKAKANKEKEEAEFSDEEEEEKEGGGGLFGMFGGGKEEDNSLEPDSVSSGNGSTMISSSSKVEKTENNISSEVRESGMGTPTPQVRRLSAIERIIEIITQIEENTRRGSGGPGTRSIGGGIMSGLTTLFKATPLGMMTSTAGGIIRGMGGGAILDRGKSMFSTIKDKMVGFSKKHPILSTIGLSMIPGVGGLAAGAFAASKLFGGLFGKKTEEQPVPQPEASQEIPQVSPEGGEALPEGEAALQVDKTTGISKDISSLNVDTLKIDEKNFSDFVKTIFTSEREAVKPSIEDIMSGQTSLENLPDEISAKAVSPIESESESSAQMQPGIESRSASIESMHSTETGESKEEPEKSKTFLGSLFSGSPITRFLRRAAPIAMNFMPPTVRFPMNMISSMLSNRNSNISSFKTSAADHNQNIANIRNEANRFDSMHDIAKNKEVTPEVVEESTDEKIAKLQAILPDSIMLGLLKYAQLKHAIKEDRKLEDNDRKYNSDLDWIVKMEI